MSACAAGSESMCEGTYSEMLSQLKGLTSSLLSRQGVALGTTVPSTAPVSGETASSSKSIKEQREEMSKVREALEKKHRADVTFAQLALKVECNSPGNELRDEKPEMDSPGTSRRSRPPQEGHRG